MGKVKITLGFVTALLMIASPVYADYDYDDDGSERNRNGSDDCAHARSTCEDNDFSPSFDKSPVDDSFIFAPTICVMPGSCTAPDE